MSSGTLGRKAALTDIAFVDENGVSYGVKQTDNVPHVHLEGSLVNESHDYIGLTYTGDNLTQVVYKNGGSSGTIVSTLTLAYTGSVLDSVTRT